MNTYIGTSGFGYQEWKGKFYPAGMPADRMLAYYSERFNAVEVNSSFYQMPDPKTLLTWMRQVPARFVFAFKAPRTITHIKRLKGAGDQLHAFLRIVSFVKKQLGPINFQLPPNFKIDIPRLTEFLNELPAEHAYSFEFRHASWFTDEVYSVLRRKKAALCVNDEIEGAPTRLIDTTDFGFLKLRRLDYAKKDLARWAKEIAGHRWKRAFVFFKHEETAAGPKFAARFSSLM